MTMLFDAPSTTKFVGFLDHPETPKFCQKLEAFYFAQEIEVLFSSDAGILASFLNIPTTQNVLLIVRTDLPQFSGQVVKTGLPAFRIQTGSSSRA